MAVFEETIEESHDITDPLAGQRIRMPSALTEWPWFWIDVADAGYVISRIAEDTTTFSDSQVLMRTGFPVAAETPEIVETWARWLVRMPTLLESPTLTTSANITFLAQLTDAFTGAVMLVAARGQHIIDEIAVSGIDATFLSYRLTEVEGAVFTDEPIWFVGASVVDSVAATDVVVYAPIRGAALLEALSMGDALDTPMHWMVGTSDSFVLSDLTSWQWLFAPLIEELIRVRGGISIPVTDGAAGTTWSVNARTGNVTEYTNYGFNSFAPQGNTYLGANEDGLHVLHGDTDGGADIIGHIRSGYLQLGGSRFASVKTVYLGMHAEGTVYLRMVLGDERMTTYRVTAKPMQTTKVPMGKGLRARYFAFELETVGQDFDLDAVEFVPLVMERRV
jgi:hypothetical protein